MDTTFVLTFGTDIGRSRTLRINNVNLAANDGIVTNAMNMMINSESISTANGGRISTPRRAQRVETLVTPIDILPDYDDN